MTKVIYSALDDGSHVHFRNGIGTPCRKNHKKINWERGFAYASAFLFFTLAVHLVLKANGL